MGRSEPGRCRRSLIKPCSRVQGLRCSRKVTYSKPLTRGQVAASSGLGREAVRFYEQRGLLADPPRSAGGYRQYSEEDVSRLHFIKRAKELGFSLKEVADLLSLQGRPDVSRAGVRMQAEAKLADIEARIRDLTRMKVAFLQPSRACNAQGSIAGCPIMAALKEVTNDH